MSDEMAEVLAGSREYIAEHGWTQDTMENRDGEVCSTGGIVRSQHWSQDDHLPYDAKSLEEVCRVLVPVISDDPSSLIDPVGTVLHWNDMPGRTMQEVLDAFAKAEKIERMGYDPDLGYSDE